MLMTMIFNCIIQPSASCGRTPQPKAKTKVKRVLVPKIEWKRTADMIDFIIFLANVACDKTLN